jgi:F-type H+-transporting ATPase subunit a
VTPILASGDGGKLDVIGHLTDPYHWDLGPLGSVDLQASVNRPLERILGFHPHITVWVVMMWCAALLLLAVFVPTVRWWRRHGEEGVPTGLRNVLEPVLLFIRDQMVYPSMGEKNGRKWLPFFWTLFFFILAVNLIGLIPQPFYVSASGNINMTAAMALITFFSINVGGVIEKGFLGYVKGIVPPGVPWWLWPLIFVLEIIGLVSRHIALTIRLFANMTAGHIILLSLLGFIFMSQSFLIASISVLGTAAMTLFEIFVAFVQAYIFTILSAIFIGAGLAHEH